MGVGECNQSTVSIDEMANVFVNRPLVLYKFL